ncbi:MAG: LysE family translocator [Halieaceae bacterium]|nr:LysE family translocator [Halieaceae bacterium]
MTLIEWASLATVCLAGAASPGPSLAVILNAVVRGHRGSGLVAAWSHAAGVGLYAAATVFGISTLLVLQPRLFALIQLAGAAYLLRMALQLLRSSASSDLEESEKQTTQRAARDAFAVAFLNPKLAVFMLALFSQFIRPGATLGESAVLVATATAIDGLWYSIVALTLARGAWLAALRRNAMHIDRIFGALLGLLALSIIGFTLSGALGA